MKIFILLLLSFSVIASEDFKTFHKPVPGQLPYFEKKDMNPIWNVSQDSKLLKIQKQNLKSHIKGKFTEKDYNGKVSAVSFFFATCPGYCPMMTKTIKHAFDQLKTDPTMMFVSYSVTPNRDTNDVLHDYANKYGINNANWHLLNGDRDTIYDFARQELYADLAIEMELKEDQFVHSEKVYLIDQKRFVRGIYNATSKKEMLQLAKDMKRLKGQ